MPHPAAATPAVDPTSHAAHDPVLVAAFAAGDATGAELETAIALVAACPTCADLDHDLRAIAAALPLMPAPRRTRDFRLTTEQAASLRPAGWRRVLAPFAGPRFAFAAPLGSGLAALGLVGILLAGTGLPLGGAAAGAAPAEAPLLAAPQMGAGSPVAEDGEVDAEAASGAPDIQGAVPAPEADTNAGSTAPGTDKSSDLNTDTPDEGMRQASPPAAAAVPSGDASRVMADGQVTAAMPGNVMLLALAAATLAVGALMVGLRVLSRRVA